MIPHKDAIPHRLIVSGIDTDAGKTVVSSLLCLGLKADYWKPVQAGRLPETDTEAVRRMTGLPNEQFHPETYLLETPASPHFAAEEEGILIDPSKLSVPDSERPLIIEGAGGLMVPLRRDFTYLDLFQQWGLPVLLVCKTYLGSINHSLLSIHALQQRGIPLAGLVFNEGGHPESEEIIASHTQAPVWGHLPKMNTLTPQSLTKVWQSNFLR